MALHLIKKPDLTVTTIHGKEAFCSIALLQSERGEVPSVVSLSDLISTPALLVALIIYYRYLVETYDRDSNPELESVYKQYKTLQISLVHNLSTVSSNDWGDLQNDLWQCLDSTSKSATSNSVQQRCAHLPVLPIYQLRRQSVSAFIVRLKQSDSDDLSESEVLIIERYFSDTKFFSPREESLVSIETLNSIQEASKTLEEWLSFFLSAPKEKFCPRRYKRYIEMILSTRDDYERHSRIKKVMESDHISEEILKWLCKVSLKIHTGKTFYDFMKIEIEECLKMARVKITMQKALSTKLDRLKKWFMGWMTYCEENWTESALQPATVQGSALLENSGATTLLISAVGDSSRIYWGARIGLPYIARAIASGIHTIQSATPYWRSNLIPQLWYRTSAVVAYNSAFYGFVGPAIQAYSLVKLVWDHRSRIVYHGQSLSTGISPYDFFKARVWKALSENLLKWIREHKSSTFVMKELTICARRAQSECTYFLGPLNFGGVLIISSEDFDKTLRQEDQRFPALYTTLKSDMGLYEQCWDTVQEVKSDSDAERFLSSPSALSLS